MKKLIILLPLLFCLGSFAQIPSGYYDSAIGLTGEELKTALHNIIDDHTTYPYTASTTDVWDILKESDRDPSNPENVILIYTGWSVNAAQEYNDGAGWSREHVWAKSHGDFDEVPPAGTDCHHLRPEDISVNSARGEKDFDNGGTQHPEATMCYTDADSWEPRPAVKGDVARMMFYMATRYQGDVAGEPDLELVNYTGTTGPLFGKLSTLLAWNEQDPVDDFERNRNEVVYSYQHNRNPFIDHPEWVNLIWNGNYNIPPSIASISKNPSNPSSSNTVSVSASVTDTDGTVIAVKLNWGLASDNLNNTIGMSLTSGTTYLTNTAIPAQNGGITVYYQVEAMDNDSATTVSIINNYTVAIPPNYPPVITDISYSPINPTNNDSVLVSATITDSDGTISSSLLKWKKSTEATIYEKQMVLSETKYQAYIPAYEAGKTIYFMISAKDDDNAETTYLNGSYSITIANFMDYRLIADKIFIYPNPVEEILSVVLPENNNVISIELYDLFGEIVQNVPVKDNSGKYTVNLSGYQSGSYLIKIKTKQSSISKIIIKK